MFYSIFQIYIYFTTRNVHVLESSLPLLSERLSVKECSDPSSPRIGIKLTREVMLKSTAVWLRSFSPVGSFPCVTPSRIPMTVALLIRSRSVVVMPIDPRVLSRASESTESTKDLIQAGALTERLASRFPSMSTTEKVGFEAHVIVGAR